MKLSIAVQKFALAASLTTLMLAAGCESASQKALDQAKAQATATNTPQQVQYVDGSGNTVTTVVQPPAAAGAAPTVSTTTTPPPAGQKPAKTNPVVTAFAPPPADMISPAASNTGAAAPAPTAAPVNISVPAGTELAIRVNETINVKHAHAGDRFSGEVVEPVTSNGAVIIPRGTPVSGRIDEAHKRGHFKGASVLELRLTAINLNGAEYSLDTRDRVMSKKGKGKRTAGFIGGLTGVGMLVGGIASGGVGLAVGAAAGAGTGTLLAGTTGNRDIVIPAESIVHFRLDDDLVVQNP